MCILNSGSTLVKHLVLTALIAISALHGQFRELRLGETATFSRLHREKKPPYRVFYKDSRNGLLLLDWLFCPSGKLGLGREKVLVLVKSLRSKLFHLLIQLQKFILAFSEDNLKLPARLKTPLQWCDMTGYPAECLIAFTWDSGNLLHW